jgi:acetyl/propionyl-CoA carboxylase alpha subunit
MDRAYRHADEVVKVSSRLEAERIRIVLDGAERTFLWSQLAAGEYLVRENGVQHRCVVARAGDDRWIWIDGHVHHLRIASDARPRAGAGAASGALVSPMPGQVLKVLVQPGDTVRKNQTVVILEAMKMQYEMMSPRDGTIATVPAREGAQVPGGVALVTLVEEGLELRIASE